MDWIKLVGFFVILMYWVVFGGGWFCGIFFVKFLIFVWMICMYIGFLIVVFMGLFLIFNEGYDMGVWVCVMLVGFVLFIIFFIMFIWIEEEFLIIIGKVVLLFLIVLLLGMMVNFIVFGILMDRLMLMWFCYLLFIESVLFLVFYLLV